MCKITNPAISYKGGLVWPIYQEIMSTSQQLSSLSQIHLNRRIQKTKMGVLWLSVQVSCFKDIYMLCALLKTFKRQKYTGENDLLLLGKRIKRFDDTFS